MKTADIIIGNEYAFRRTRRGRGYRRVVIDAGKYGPLVKWRNFLNERAFAAIRERAGLSDDVTIRVADENATVAIRAVDEKTGEATGEVLLVAARTIIWTWEEEAQRQAEAREFEERRRAARARAEAEREALRPVWDAEVAEFRSVLASLLPEGKRGVVSMTHLRYSDETEVTITRDAVKALLAALADEAVAA